MNKEVDDAMHSWLSACGNPTSVEAADAIVACLLQPADDASGHRYCCTHLGRDWLIANAISNGASPTEARHSLDYLDGVY